MIFLKHTDILHELSGKKLSLEVDDSSLTLTETQAFIDEDGVESVSQISSSTIHFKDIKYDCSVFIIDDTKAAGIHNVFAETNISKESIPQYVKRLGINSKLVLSIPFASDPSSFVVAVRGQDGVEVSLPDGAQFSGTFTKGDHKKFLPSLTRVGTEEINSQSETSVLVQLCDINGVKIAKEGVTIYLENVSGSTDESRYITDANGQCFVKCKASSSGNFRAKLGFRFFSGVLDITN